jgi:hypothetical protein
MAVVRAKVVAFSFNAYRGDAKTLLAFNLDAGEARRRLAGFTIAVQPPSKELYYIQNNLRFETPGNHAQLPTEPSFSSINAPIHKFRWLHVPGSVHQGLKPEFGPYTYTVTPRYFDSKGILQPLDQNLSASLQVDVDRFSKGKVSLGFTRGFTHNRRPSSAISALRRSSGLRNRA